MTTTVTPRPKAGFHIGVTCPACGGELELERDFYVLTCPHCNSVLRVMMPETAPAFMVKRKKQLQEVRPLVDRYCKENALPLTGSYFQSRSVLYPYWKIDAVTLKVRHTVYEVDNSPDEDLSSEANTEEREFTSIALTPFEGSVAAGPQIQEIPATLGIRAEYLRLIPYSDENIGESENSLPITVEFDHGIAQVAKGLGRLTTLDGNVEGKNRTELLHARGSLIYFPYFIADSQAGSRLVRFVVDGITGRVAGHAWMDEALETPPEENPITIPFGKLDVTLHRCPNCGVDLKATRAFVYQCHNCDRIFFMEKDPRLSDQIQLAGRTAGKDQHMVPFWVVRVPSELSAQLGRLFGGIYRSDRLVIPAFKMRNLEAMFRLCKRMSPMAPKLTTSPCLTLGKDQLDVTLSLEDALTMVELIWRREIVGRNQQGKSAEIPFTTEQISLLFVPFKTEQYFFVDAVSGVVTFERGSLA